MYTTEMGGGFLLFLLHTTFANMSEQQFYCSFSGNSSPSSRINFTHNWSTVFYYVAQSLPPSFGGKGRFQWGISAERSN
jgi:hypothetical protein